MVKSSKIYNEEFLKLGFLKVVARLQRKFRAKRDKIKYNDRLKKLKPLVKKNK